MKRAYVKCPYCGAQAMLRPAHVVHGNQAKQGQYLYVCNRYPKCDAYVGVHAKSLLPLGTLANGDLRHKRILAHRAFEQLQRTCKMEKWQAYQWLQAKFSLRRDQAHIAKFSVYMCDQLIAACEEVEANHRRAA